MHKSMKLGCMHLVIKANIVEMCSVFPAIFKNLLLAHTQIHQIRFYKFQIKLHHFPFPFLPSTPSMSLHYPNLSRFKSMASLP